MPYLAHYYRTRHIHVPSFNNQYHDGWLLATSRYLHHILCLKSENVYLPILMRLLSGLYAVMAVWNFFPPCMEIFWGFNPEVLMKSWQPRKKSAVVQATCKQETFIALKSNTGKWGDQSRDQGYNSTCNNFLQNTVSHTWLAIRYISYIYLTKINTWPLFCICWNKSCSFDSCNTFKTMALFNREIRNRIHDHELWHRPTEI